jgi:hypothetical protein
MIKSPIISLRGAAAATKMIRLRANPARKLATVFQYKNAMEDYIGK